MKDEQPISRRTMFIGLRVFAILVFVAGCLYAGSGTEVRVGWQAGLYGAAIGGFLGRALFWFIIAVYAWMQAKKYRDTN